MEHEDEIPLNAKIFDVKADVSFFDLCSAKALEHFGLPSHLTFIWPPPQLPWLYLAASL